MVEIFDRFLQGEIELKDLDLNSYHLNDRIAENSLNKDDVINALLNEEIVHQDTTMDGKYVIYYTCAALKSKPKNKDHKYYKMILNCDKGSVVVITIIPTTDLFRDNKSKHKDGLVAKAFSKRKNLY